MAQYKGSSTFVIPRPVIHKNGINVETITTTKTMVLKDSFCQILTNNTVSALTCILPGRRDGLCFWIKSAGSNTINANDPVSGATVAAIATGETAFLMSDGSAWYQVIKA